MRKDKKGPGSRTGAFTELQELRAKIDRRYGPLVCMDCHRFNSRLAVTCVACGGPLCEAEWQQLTF